jgi:hypothetical protein
MRRQRLEETPPPNRVAASPYRNDDFYHSTEDYDSDNDGSPFKLRRDSDGDLQAKSRSNSFTKVEDFANAFSGAGNNDGYYKSFVMESPPPKINEGAGSLHHRHQNGSNTTPAQKYSRYDSNDYDDESPQHRLMRQRAFLSPHKHHAIEQLHDKHHSSPKMAFAPLAKLSTTRLARWVLGIGVSFYLVLLMRSTHYLGEDFMPTKDVSNAPDIWDPKSDCFIGSSRTRGMGCQYLIPSWFKEQSKQVEDTRSKREARRNERRDRTKLPTTSKNIANDWHHIASLDEKDKLERTSYENGGKSSTEHKTDYDSFASIDALCGISAKNSSVISPESYPSRAALNENSKVLITGVLNPVGLSLALRLKQHCGVQHVMGVDAMYPNTVQNRLLMQDRIKLLNSNSNGVASTKQVILPFFGLDPKTKAASSKNVEESKKQDLENELAWMQSFKPTHVVHLASYSMDVYNDALLDPEWKNIYSPYISDDNTLASRNNEDQKKVEPYFYPLRSGMVSMEQLLQTIAGFPENERPQFLYAGRPLQSNTTIDNRSKLFRTMKHMDELLADIYHSRNNYGLPSIGMRLPNSIYGPWGHAGSTIHGILARAVEEHSGSLQNYTTSSMEGRTNNDGSDRLDLLFVDDAVDAIISALQYRFDKPTTVTVPAERNTSVESLSSTVKSLLHGNSTDHFILPINNVKTTLENQKEQSLILPKTEQTPLKDGLVKSIAWHMDRLTPFGPAPISTQDADNSTDTKPVETGDKFLQRHKMKTCRPYDVSCHKNNDYLPCNSECNTHQNCVPSIFDETRELIYNVSEGCDIAMYTQMLGYNVEDAELHAEYMDDSDLDDDELLVCNFAFVPRESDLVSLVTSKVPSEQLAKFGIEPRSSDRSSRDLRERKLDVLNGRLLYRGWILIWVKDGVRELSAPDASLMKLSPSKFFHPSVRYGLFVEDNFKVSPNLDDVLFLVDQMHRQKLPTRSLKKEVEIESPNGPITKKVKISIPGEPARRAAILFAPLRYPNIDDPIIEQYREGNRKLTMNHATKFMGYEVGYQPGEKESHSLRRQREFYDRILSNVNKQNELRSNFEPLYRFDMRHWIRSRWVLHDFTLEEARLLRCDWYQEHVQWGNDLDQLSFAKIMGMRDINRRIAHKEPDDHVKSFVEEHPELHDLIDSYEWHPMETEMKNLYHEPVNWNSYHLASTKVTIGANGDPKEGEDLVGENAPLYVRIMSERVMDISRKIWTKMRKNLAKAKRKSGSRVRK